MSENLFAKAAVLQNYGGGWYVFWSRASVDVGGVFR